MLEFLKNTFSECDGCASFARVATAVTILCTMAFMGMYLHWKHEFPSYDVIFALSVLMTAPYGTNKLGEVIGNVKDSLISLKKTPATTPVEK